MKAETKDKVPNTQHFAALVFKKDSVYHEGDERSRTHPGHGYPAYTETIRTVDYIVFKSKAEMEEWVLKKETEKPQYYSEPTQYRILNVTPLTATIKATVSIA